jgi:hypothetical protein
MLEALFDNFLLVVQQQEGLQRSIEARGRE